MQYEVGIYISWILRRVGSMPNGEIIFMNYSLWSSLFVFYTFLVDCRYELLIDLCCLMTLWKTVFCIFLYYSLIFYYLLLPDFAWLCLNKTQLVIVLSVLCGWVPLYWRQYLLISDTDVCATPTALRTRGCAALQWLIVTWETSYL